MGKREIILICYGEGGHSTAMNRLWSHIEFPPHHAIQMLEQHAIALTGIQSYAVPRIMPKYNNPIGWFFTPINIAKNLSKTLSIYKRYKVKTTISTGPGIAIIPSLFARIAGRRVIYLESWCRFESLSLTARLLLHLDIQIYVQNYELLRLHPKLRYCGRL